MPTLEWIGKKAVQSYDTQVPMRVLDKQYSFGEESENMIIHGDNLEVLKSLQLNYKGKIKCIYIDPPYNTGNENWVYNDNVNSPQIRRWLNQVVGKEGEDLSRHDKWLCMMYPRLKLLRELLADNGAIFISIDDTEQANLKLLCDEIFGSNNFVANIIWRRRKSQANLSNNISPIHDFIVCYANNITMLKLNKITANIETSKYKNPDNDLRGSYVSMPCTNKGGSLYTIKTPTGKLITDEWRFKEETYNNLLIDNRIVFPNNGNGKPRYKLFLKEKLEDGAIANTLWDNESSNQEATVELKNIFNNKCFDTPKPTQLIRKIAQLASDKDSIILDSFAGSGTTGHAVLNLNKEDGGNRKFILVEMEDYAETITAQRVKKVIEGYGEGTNKTEGTGGGFSFYELGEPIMQQDEQDEKKINEKLSLDKIREYIFFTETHKALKPNKKSKNPYFLNTYKRTAYYFYYKKEEETHLNLDFLASMDIREEENVVYADTCQLPKTMLAKNNITFRKIPRDIKEI